MGLKAKIAFDYPVHSFGGAFEQKLAAISRANPEKVLYNVQSHRSDHIYVPSVKYLR